MNSYRSYVVNALIDWIVDNGCTPHLIIDDRMPDVEVPAGFSKNHRVVLNVSGSAVRGFKLDSDGLEFHARFGGVSHLVRCPVGAIVGIFAKENGQGMAFEPEETGSKNQQPFIESTSAGGERKRAADTTHLRIVKD